MLKLGRLLEKGSERIERNVPEAIALFERAADLGNLQATMKAAQLYYQGSEGLPRDLAKAFPLFLAAAESGETGAICYLGDCLEYDEEFAVVDACQLAADAENSFAKYILEVMLQKGERVKKLHSMAAVGLFRKAADRGHGRAMGRLGISLYYGNGTQRDIANAIEWFGKAERAAPFDFLIKAALAKALLAEESGSFKDPIRAIRLLEEAVQLYPDYCYGLHLLAVQYCLQTEGLTTSKKRIAELFSQASSSSHTVRRDRFPLTATVIKAGEYYPAVVENVFRKSFVKPRMCLLLVLGGAARGKTSTVRSLRGLPFVKAHVATEMAALNKFIVEPGIRGLPEEVLNEYDFNENSLRANVSRLETPSTSAFNMQTANGITEDLFEAVSDAFAPRQPCPNQSIFETKDRKHADVIELMRDSLTLPDFPSGFRKSVAQVWDMGGQSKYEMAHSLVIARGSILVFVTDLKRVADERTRISEVAVLCYWMQLAHFLVCDEAEVRVIIVGTRKSQCDEVATLRILKKSLGTQLSPKVYNSWIRTRKGCREDFSKFIVIENSRTLQGPKESGLEELERSVAVLADEIVARRGNVPVRWLALVDKLERENARLGYLLFQRDFVLQVSVEFPGFAKDNEERENDVVCALRCFASMGRLTFLKLDETEWYVFVDVGRIAGLLGKLTMPEDRLQDQLSSEDIESLAEGQISQSGLFCLWNAHSEEENQLMLKILCRFDLLVLLKGTEESIWEGNAMIGIPALMRSGWDDFKWGSTPGEKDLEVVTEFEEAIPNSLLGFLIAHVYHMQAAGRDPYSRIGGEACKFRADALLIRLRDGSRAFMCLNGNERKIVWKFRGMNPERLAADFIGSLDGGTDNSSRIMNVNHRHVIFLDCSVSREGCGAFRSVEIELSREWLLERNGKRGVFDSELLKRLAQIMGRYQESLPVEGLCCRSCFRPWTISDVEHSLGLTQTCHPGGVSPLQRVMPPNHYDVFISHAGPDKMAMANPLYQSLTRHNVNVFLDFEGLQILDSTASEEMNRAMNEARIGVFILSPEFAAREWTMRELRCFLDRDETCRLEKRSRPVLLPIFHRLSLTECSRCDELVYNENSEHYELLQAERFYEQSRQDICTTEGAIAALKGLRRHAGVVKQRLGGGDYLSSAELVETAAERILGYTLKYRGLAEDMKLGCAQHE
ncbi:Sel1-repeat containing protein [Chondrus crispus]|uniref:Sel1-repeat containing protein n=1 Tax=Chondrus crispus TaxID=2769 RepID=R7Q514_CHOCR|nr:Sel1-repeat containing protein [Chondrus crispus]CDF33637.1 Sel1-repeat containing protein [Chondrus crispus]|eukprot:XP_005713456.1 Sel1-repeat containing protein [Chondrus crispus]